MEVKLVDIWTSYFFFSKSFSPGSYTDFLLMPIPGSRADIYWLPLSARCFAIWCQLILLTSMPSDENYLYFTGKDTADKRRMVAFQYIIANLWQILIFLTQMSMPFLCRLTHKWEYHLHVLSIPEIPKEKTNQRQQYPKTYLVSLRFTFPV